MCLSLSTFSFANGKPVRCPKLYGARAICNNQIVLIVLNFCVWKFSLFGRAFAVNGCALSKCMYAAQFVGLPEGSLRDYIDRLVAAAVDPTRYVLKVAW